MQSFLPPTRDWANCGAANPQSAIRNPPSAAAEVRLGALILLLALAVLVRPATVRAEDNTRPERNLRLGNVEVAYHPGDAGLARQAAAVVRRASENVSRDLGIALARPVKVWLARGPAEFDRLCGDRMQPWALAAALPAESAIVVNAAILAPATANDMSLTLFHEVVHLALFQAEKDQPAALPLWFHEGVATWFSGRRHMLGDRSIFELAAAQDALIPFDSIERRFPTDASRAGLAYLQSEAFVAHITARRSPEALRWILDRYRSGEPFDEAFKNALGISRSAMERGWRKTLRRRFPWLRMIWEATTLFGVLALVTVLAFALVRLRARRQHRRWTEEEEIWTLARQGDEAEDTEESQHP